jgi:hypothetical protein
MTPTLPAFLATVAFGALCWLAGVAVGRRQACREFARRSYLAALASDLARLERERAVRRGQHAKARWN